MEKNIHAEGVSRRGLLEGVGILAGGSLASGAAVAMAQPIEEIPPALGHINHLSYVCAGCRLCEITCTLTHEGKINPTLSRNIVHKDIQAGDVTNVLYCQQCDDPKCLKACPTGALHVDPQTGARVIDQDVCIGCQSCLKACVFYAGGQGESRIKFNKQTNTCIKCDLCGGDPQCVKFCPIGASQASWIEYRKLVRPGIDDYATEEVTHEDAIENVAFSREIGGQQAAKGRDCTEWILVPTQTGAKAIGRIGSSDGGTLRITLYAIFKDEQGNVLGTSNEVRRRLYMHDEVDYELAAEGVDAHQVASVVIAGDISYWVDDVDVEY